MLWEQAWVWDLLPPRGPEGYCLRQSGPQKTPTPPPPQHGWKFLIIFFSLCEARFTAQLCNYLRKLKKKPQNIQRKRRNLISFHENNIPLFQNPGHFHLRNMPFLPSTPYWWLGLIPAGGEGLVFSALWAVGVFTQPILLPTAHRAVVIKAGWAQVFHEKKPNSLILLKILINLGLCGPGFHLQAEDFRQKLHFWGSF